MPHVPDERLAIDDLGYSDDGITHVTARFGYMDRPTCRPAPADPAAGVDCGLDEDAVSYFLSTIELHLGSTPGMSRWRKNLFLATSGSRPTPPTTSGFRRERTVIMGSRIDFSSQ